MATTTTTIKYSMNSIKLNLKRHQGRQAGIQKERAVETIILFVPDIHFLFLI